MGKKFLIILPNEIYSEHNNRIMYQTLLKRTPSWIFTKVMGQWICISPLKQNPLLRCKLELKCTSVYGLKNWNLRLTTSEYKDIRALTSASAVSRKFINTWKAGSLYVNAKHMFAKKCFGMLLNIIIMFIKKVHV